MGEDSQNFPLAHYQAHHNTDEELATMKALKKERTNKCFIYIFSAFVILSVVVLIFALVVLRVSSPTLELSSVAVRNLSYNTNSSSPSFNLTLVAVIAVENPNFGPFDFEAGGVGVAYGAVVVGEGSTGAGRARAKGTGRVTVSVGAWSNALLDTKNVSGDLNSGVLRLRSYGKLRGRVKLIEIFKRRVTAEMSCAMAVDLRSRQVQDLVCE